MNYEVGVLQSSTDERINMPEILRDPIWQGVGVIITLLLGIIGFYYAGKNKAWLIIAGAIVILISGFALGIRSPKNSAPLSVQSQSCDQYGIKIVSPQNHSDVFEAFEISGTYEKQPPDGYVLVYLTPDGKSFWGQSVVEFNPLTKTWVAQGKLLGDPTSQKLVGDFIVVLVGKSGRLYYDYYWRASQESGHWVYFDGLTADTSLCAQVSLQRTK